MAGYSRKLVPLLIGVSLLKVVVSACTGLGNDEVYYWTYALQPDLNHFDHPPIVGLMIWATTFGLHWANSLSLRLGGILGCCASTWFVFQIGKIMFSEKAGWYAALLYNACIYTGFIASMFVLPDSPEMPFWTAALWLMARIVFQGRDGSGRHWLCLGLAIGLSCLCKVHGLYLWAGFGSFLLFKRTRWMLRPWPFLSGAVSLVCLLPIVAWNLRNDWANFRFHADRVGSNGPDWENMLKEMVGEVIYQNPVLFAMMVVAVFYFLGKKGPRWGEKGAFLFFLGPPMIVFFWQVALFGSSLPHWSGPGYVPVLLLLGHYLAQRSRRTVPVSVGIGGGLIVAVLLLAVPLINAAPFNIGSQDPATFGENCPTLDLNGWDDFGHRFDSLARADAAKMKPGAPVLATDWFPAGHLEFYVSRPSGHPVLGVGPIADIHKFHWLNRDRRPLAKGDDAYYIVPSNVPKDKSLELLRGFEALVPADTLYQVRGGRPVRYFKVYRLKGFHGWP